MAKRVRDESVKAGNGPCSPGRPGGRPSATLAGSHDSRRSATHRAAELADSAGPVDGRAHHAALHPWCCRWHGRFLECKGVRLDGADQRRPPGLPISSGCRRSAATPRSAFPATGRPRAKWRSRSSGRRRHSISSSGCRNRILGPHNRFSGKARLHALRITGCADEHVGELPATRCDPLALPRPRAFGRSPRRVGRTAFLIPQVGRVSR